MRTLTRAALAVLLAAGLIAPVGAGSAAADPRPDAPEVVGGDRVRDDDFGWVVRLSVGCGGSLIAPRYVLTAAHCVPGSGRVRSIVVSAGATDLDSPDMVSVRAVRVVRAEGFRTATRGHDWAVVRLERALDLPTVRLADDRRLDRGTFTVLGWGAVREGGSNQRRLRAARVPFVDDERCEDAYSRAGYPFVGPEMICAGDLRRGGVDACQGDSGGPLARRDADGRWVQVGIVSWGQGCGRRRFPGVYTQVSRFAASITAASGRSGGGR